MRNILIPLNCDKSGYKLFTKKQVQPEESCADFPLAPSFIPSSIVGVSGKSGGRGLIPLLNLLAL